MSRASKLTLAGFSTFALSTIVFVHFQQQSEKAVCVLTFPFPLSLSLRFSRNCICFGVIGRE